MTFLSKVEDVFQVPGRGCVIVPEVPPRNADFGLRVQDSIQLRNPDGRVVNTHIVGIEMACGPAVGCRSAFLLPACITTRDVPNGTEIWLV